MSQLNSVTIKSILGGILAFAIDKYVFNEEELNNSIMLGVSTVVGIYGGDLLASTIPDNLKTQFINGKKIESDVLEILGAGAVTYGVNSMINKPIPIGILTEKIGTIILSDVIATYSTEYLLGQALSFTN